MTKEASPDKAIVKSPSGRTKRASDVKRGPLTVRGLESGYHYRFVNDEDDKVAAFQEAGYEPVLDKDVSIGDKRVDRASPEGTVKSVSVGGGTRAVLMRIRQDWYDEDQIEKEKHIRALEQTTKQEALEGNYGKIHTYRD